MAHYETLTDAPAPNGHGAGRSAAAEALASRIAASGAIMSVAGSPDARFLVGEFAWLQHGRIFWFTAYGDSLADGHVLEFDEARSIEPAGVAFSRHGQPVAHLLRIEHAGVEDPDDYRIAWQLWQEVAPLRTAMIEHCRSTLAEARGAGRTAHAGRRRTAVA